MFWGGVNMSDAQIYTKNRKNDTVRGGLVSQLGGLHPPSLQGGGTGAFSFRRECIRTGVDRNGVGQEVKCKCATAESGVHKRVLQQMFICGAYCICSDRKMVGNGVKLL